MSFNPSTGLSVFQTSEGVRSVAQLWEFQSLDWVERLSDPHTPGSWLQTQSFNPSTGLSVFQTRQWIERAQQDRRFNPSTGLSVFQTPTSAASACAARKFQSLDWVERLSDGAAGGCRTVSIPVSIPRLG